MHLYVNFPELLWFLFVKLFKDINWISGSSYLWLKHLQKLEVKLQHLESRPIFLGRKGWVEPGEGGAQKEMLYTPRDTSRADPLCLLPREMSISKDSVSQKCCPATLSPCPGCFPLSPSSPPPAGLRVPSVSHVLAPSEPQGRGQASETARSCSLPSCLPRGGRGWS